MKQIDLEPTAYRPKGSEPLPDRKKIHNIAGWVGVVSGIWAAGMWFLSHEGALTANVFINLGIIFGPAAVTIVLYEAFNS